MRHTDWVRMTFRPDFQTLSSSSYIEQIEPISIFLEGGKVVLNSKTYTNKDTAFSLKFTFYTSSYPELYL